MRDTPTLHLDPEPDLTWEAQDGSEQNVSVFLDASAEGVMVTLQTLTCRHSATVVTHPMPPEVAFSLARMISAAALDATFQMGRSV